MSEMTNAIHMLVLTLMFATYVLVGSYGEVKEEDNATVNIISKSRIKDNNTKISSSLKEDNYLGDDNVGKTKNTTIDNRLNVSKSNMNKEIMKSILRQSEFYYTKSEYGTPVVIEKHKLIWFIIPKAGSTSILDLLYKLLHPNTTSILARKELLLHLPKLKDYSIDKASDMMLDPEWTKVMVVRDPKARLLSAYLGKALLRPHYFRRMCCKEKYVNYTSSLIKNTTQPDCLKHNFSFVEFINVTMECHNIHWKSHVDFVANHIEFINFIIDFNNLASDAERLLKKLGIWLTVGATGWGKNGTNAVFRENEHHYTNSSAYYEYYTPELEKIVEDRYRLDYELLKKRHEE